MREPPKLVMRGAGATALAGMLTFLSACGPPQPTQPTPRAHSNEIVAAVRPGPASWFPGPDGAPSGFDHDLLVRFAREQARPLRIITVSSAADLLAKVENGDADIGVGGLFQAGSAKTGPLASASDATLKSDAAL